MFFDQYQEFWQVQQNILNPEFQEMTQLHAFEDRKESLNCHRISRAKQITANPKSHIGLHFVMEGATIARHSGLY
jgi:hypothetical protein